jgi:hypothetical protein
MTHPIEKRIKETNGSKKLAHRSIHCRCSTVFLAPGVRSVRALAGNSKSNDSLRNTHGTATARKMNKIPTETLNL